MTEQLTLTVESPVADLPTGRQHRAVLLALRDSNGRGMTGEEAATYCGIRLASTASTRFEEMSVDTKQRDRFPIPLVAKTSERRATASGRLAVVWQLSDVGALVASELERSAS